MFIPLSLLSNCSAGSVNKADKPPWKWQMSPRSVSSCYYCGGMSSCRPYMHTAQRYGTTRRMARERVNMSVSTTRLVAQPQTDSQYLGGEVECRTTVSHFLWLQNWETEKWAAVPVLQLISCLGSTSRSRSLNWPACCIQAEISL